jgi:hypothetical protein
VENRTAPSLRALEANNTEKASVESVLTMEYIVQVQSGHRMVFTIYWHQGP